MAVATSLGAAESAEAPFAELDRVAAEPVLRVESLTSPVVIESLELLRNRSTFLVRVRSAEGAEGISIPNASRLVDAYPIFLNRVAPFCVGKDARRWEEHLWELYRHNSNYKFQGLAFWVCVAAAETAVLDLLGKLAGQSIGQLLGGVHRREIAVYRASGNRGNRPEEEIDYLQQLIAETGAKAVKFRLGGRMSNNADSLPGRTETLIPLARRALGDAITLYADSNSSYDAQHAIQIGRLMEASEYGFFEEPCRFDHLEETKQVADALSIPVAGGEQEFSHWRFRSMIGRRVVDVVQPDLHYYGGFVRSLRVARMADAVGMTCTPHMSGSGLGHLDVAHFVSCLPNPATHHEFKGNTRLPVHCDTSSLKCENGVLQVPSGPGYGVTIDPDFVKRAKKVVTI
jgi:L-alanine-DL-glutamate epimerase-like enolase superfamily enzyme